MTILQVKKALNNPPCSGTKD